MREGPGNDTSFSKEIYRKACEDALEFRGHFQHPVGMSVHDVGRHKGKPLEVGMVFSIDPMIWVHEEKHIHSYGGRRGGYGRRG